MLSASLNKTFPSFLPGGIAIWVFKTRKRPHHIKEGNVLYSDVLTTYYLWLIWCRAPSDSKKRNLLSDMFCFRLLLIIDSVPAFEAVGRRIDPSQWTQLQFGLFSVPTSGPQLVYQRPWYVLFCLWKSAYKRSLAAYRKE